MNVELKHLGLTIVGTLRDLSTGKLKGPLFVSEDGEPLAVIIRYKAYAPRLDRFGWNEEGWLVCNICPAQTVINGKTRSVLAAVELANHHWNTHHRETT